MIKIKLIKLKNQKIPIKKVITRKKNKIQRKISIKIVKRKKIMKIQSN